MQFEVKLGISPAAAIREGSQQQKTCVVSTRRPVLTTLVSGSALKPTTEQVVVNLSVPSDFLMESYVSEL